LEQFVSDLYTDRRFRLFWGVDRHALIERLKEAAPQHFQQVCEQVYLASNTQKEKEVSCIIDKNPVYSIFTRELIALYPKAQFVHMIRDPRASTLSHKNAFHAKSVSYLTHKWLDHNLAIEALKKRVPDQFHTIRYEDLVASPEDEIRALCKFLSLSFHPAMLEHQQTTSKLKHQQPGYFRLHHTNVLKPLNNSLLNKWKTELSKTEIQTIEYIGGSYSSSMGYTKTEAATSGTLKWKIAFYRFAFFKQMLRWFYLGPLFFRKYFFIAVAFFFDKKYKT
jgi:hypothetical protein